MFLVASLPLAAWTDPQETIISGLLPETTYSITVAAYTTKGDGARSKPKVITTTGAGEHVARRGGGSAAGTAPLSSS